MVGRFKAYSAPQGQPGGLAKIIRRAQRGGLWVAGLGLAGLGLSQLGMRLAARHAPLQLGAPAAIVTQAAQPPSEAPVQPKIVPYNVPADQPKIIRLPSFDAEGLIQKVGVNNRHQLAAPTNVNVAGWYAYGSKPGQAGLSVIDGHISGKYTKGIFYRLNKLKPADEFTVEFGNGRQQNFTVVYTREVSAAEASTKLWEKDPALESQLNLITCAGSFDSKQHAYPNRTIVTARPR